MSEEMSNEELAVLLKYGDMETALFSWWGRKATIGDEWEYQVVCKWLESEKAKGKRG